MRCSFSIGMLLVEVNPPRSLVDSHQVLSFRVLKELSCRNIPQKRSTLCICKICKMYVSIWKGNDQNMNTIT